MSSEDNFACTVELRVGGMDCAGCAASIEGALKKVAGVADARADVVGGRVTVVSERGPVARDQLAAAIRRAGYQVEAEGTAGDASPGMTGIAGNWQRHGRGIAATVAGLTLGLGMLADALDAPHAVGLALLGISSIGGGWFVVPRGLRAAWNRALDMNFLMSLAAAGAWVIGEQTEAAATLFLFAIAELLESHSMDRARNAIKALMDLSPAEATVVRQGREIRVPAIEVAAGETVIVRPGEKLPVDGIVTGGYSSVNQAPITGESLPVEKAVDSEVFAGTLNGQGVLEIRSVKAPADTTLARIIHAVEEAQASRSPSQTFVDRFAKVYTPLVVLAAVALAVVPPLVGAGSSELWVYRALAMLVVACPCALVISTPISIVSGLTGAAATGILIKGGAYMEALGRATVVCLDKTGTLTEGRPSLATLHAFDGSSEDELLGYAIGVERHSEHPLAQAVVHAARQRGIELPQSDRFEGLPGRGARAEVAGVTVYVGNERLLSEERLATPETLERLREVEAQGQTAVAVALVRAHERRVLGVLGIADRIRPDAKAAIEALRNAGLRRVVMLTGDNEGTARAIALAAGISEFSANMLPADKVKVVSALKESGERVIFVGDGVNDAPALAASNVGVAMGAAGTDVALETADVALMSDDLLKLPQAIHLSRRTLRIVKQNIAVSLAIKAVFLILAVSGWATLWMAVAADMGGSLLVVANGLRARRVPGAGRYPPSRA